MTDTFKPGEVAIYVRPGSPYYGEEVEILSGLEYCDDLETDDSSGPEESFYGYRISDLDNSNEYDWYARPEHLRKKKPPSREIDQVTSWDKCVWKPREMVDA